jgi:hypothetical protein
VVTDQLYRYSAASWAGGEHVSLTTSGGVTVSGRSDHPYFFDGGLVHPGQAATALLAVARVARSRYYVPPGSIGARISNDPVVTSNGDRLRFEAFSSCCGVYARYDVLADGMDGDVLDHGTTNVDVNPPLRNALALVGDSGLLHLQVGAEELTAITGEGMVVEKRVPLPARWLKGFAEVGVAAADMASSARPALVEARRFLQSLPRGSGAHRPLWAVPSGRSLRLVSKPAPGAVCLPGPERLEALLPLLRYASALTVYGPESGAGSAPQPSAWELEMSGGRLTLVLSPEVARGFSGEGRVLAALTADGVVEDADLVADALSWESGVEVSALQAPLPPERVRAALLCLGSAGRVGFDLAEGDFFRRELPYDADAVMALHPRAGAARRLASAGSVRVDSVDSGLVRVRSGSAEYLVRLRGSAGASCTCRWWSRYRGERGPCKHVLAATMTANDQRESV